jgi:hypothetical protein
MWLRAPSETWRRPVCKVLRVRTRLQLQELLLTQWPIWVSTTGHQRTWQGASHRNGPLSGKVPTLRESVTRIWQTPAVIADSGAALKFLQNRTLMRYRTVDCPCLQTVKQPGSVLRPEGKQKYEHRNAFCENGGLRRAGDYIGKHHAARDACTVKLSRFRQPDKTP